MKLAPTIPTKINKHESCCLFCLRNTFNKKVCSLIERISILEEGRPHFIHQLGLLSSKPLKIKSMSETRAEASTAPTEIENLVLLSANDISAFPKWSPTVIKEEHNRDIITEGTLTSPFSCKTHTQPAILLYGLLVNPPNTHTRTHRLAGSDTCLLRIMLFLVIKLFKVNTRRIGNHILLTTWEIH